jgi:hypothetical protein
MRPSAHTLGDPPLRFRVSHRRLHWPWQHHWFTRNYERFIQTLANWHYLAFACLMVHRFTELTSSP